MPDISFTEMQQDVIVELVNMGIGKAAEALGQIIHNEVLLSVPSIEFIGYDDLVVFMKKVDKETPTAVMQKFNGDFSGNAMLIFPEQSGTTLVKMMLQDTVDSDRMKELEEEALLEIGNIILNACFGQLGNLLSTNLDGGLPSYKKSDVEDILSHSEVYREKTGLALLLQVNFSLKESETKGFVMFAMDLDSLTTFRDKVDQYLCNVLGRNRK